MTDDRWHCPCGYVHPVATMVADHKERCPTMPQSPPSLCVEPGCGTPTRKARCPEHARDYDRATRDPGRQKVYRSKRWKVVRKRVLARDVWCKATGCNNLGTDVDHVTALRDSDDPFDETNLQALCKRHHSQKTASEVWGRKA